jgi:hypothetical protein
MAVEYPDIMGDYFDARQRFDAGGLHYICSVEPATMAPGGVTEFLFLVQSAIDVPLELALRTELPTRTGPLGRPISFETAQPEIRVNIVAGEVGLLHVPLTCEIDTPLRTYDIKVSLKTTPSGPSGTVRAPRSHGRLGKSLIRDPIGLGIAPVIGVGYVAKPETRQTFQLEVVGESETGEVDLSPSFDTLWTPEQFQDQHTAQREVSDRRPHILSKLSADALYAAIWQESLPLFEDAGLSVVTSGGSHLSDQNSHLYGRDVSQQRGLVRRSSGAHVDGGQAQ